MLTKSKFKLALSCPTKLYYKQHKERYIDSNQSDDFLKSLAQGGFQVEELARLHYPDGVLIEGNDGDYDWLVNQTNQLLKQDKVVIYEAAFKFENLFIRTDILVKDGSNIQLIEVKAKSFDPNDDYTFIGKRGGLVSSWKPYLWDIAFQHHVIKSSYPEWKVSSFLLLADKTKKASIDGLNQLFRISSNSENRTGIIKRINTLEETGDSVLGTINVQNIVDDILSGRHKQQNLTFNDLVKLFSDHYIEDKKITSPIGFENCKKCEYKTRKDNFLSGYEECWTSQKGWTNIEFDKPNGFDIWNFRSGQKLFENHGKILMEDYIEDDFNVKVDPSKISSSERRWIQVEKNQNNDTSQYLLKEELKEEMDKWDYPLNFIDFETSGVALPFYKGRRPYEQVAFQFSHHILEKDGSVKHQTEFINTTAGKFPNFEFIRELKKALEQNNGSVFKYSTHENSILNTIYSQLKESYELDKEELMDFIKSITHSKKDSVEKWCGERDMIDMCEVVKNYYYDPLMKGSNSIKVVLPAILNTSDFIKQKYSQEIKKLDITSFNFPENHIWVKNEGDEVLNPYKLLPPVFDNWTEDELDNILSDIDDISNGGAALTAYSKLQYEDMSEKERKAIKASLLKYCELDTLAMVMIFEAWKDWCRNF